MSADSMNSVFGFIGILAVGCGIYCLYAYFNMKKTDTSMKRFSWGRVIQKRCAKIRKHI